MAAVAAVVETGGAEEVAVEVVVQTRNNNDPRRRTGESDARNERKALNKKLKYKRKHFLLEKEGIKQRKIPVTTQLMV